MSMKHIAFIVALASASLTSIAKADEAIDIEASTANALNCSTLPGSTLCRDIRVADSYLVSCTGGCDGLLVDQTRALNRVANSYFDVLLPGMSVDKDLAMQAYNTAVKLCNYQWKDAPGNLVTQWAIAANRALNGLKDVQTAGNLVTKKYCQMTVRDN